MMRAPLILPSRKTPDREEWWVQEVKTGKLYGPFGPGAIWFETPRELRGVSRLALQNRADLLLSEAAVGWERLQKALAFLQINGIKVYRDFMERELEPRQAPALVGMRGGTDTRAYLGDAAATGEGGLHVDDSKNGTTFAGYAGGAGETVSNGRGRDGAGPGRGSGGSGGNVANQGGGGGGGYGAAGTNGVAGTIASSYGEGGPAHGVPNIWEALRSNTFTQAILMPGGGGGGGAADTAGGNGGAGGAGGTSYIEVATGTLSTVARTLTGVNGGAGGANQPGGGGGGSGGLWLGIAASIAYGSGTIATGPGSGGVAGGGNGGAGGNGRVVQIYFDAKATLTVSGAVETQYRILRSVPAGMPTFL